MYHLIFGVSAEKRVLQRATTFWVEEKSHTEIML